MTRPSLKLGEKSSVVEDLQACGCGTVSLCVDMDTIRSDVAPLRSAGSLGSVQACRATDDGMANALDSFMASSGLRGETTIIEPHDMEAPQSFRVAPVEELEGAMCI